MRTARLLALVRYAAVLAFVWSSAAAAEPELTHTRLFETDGKDLKDFMWVAPAQAQEEIRFAKQAPLLFVQRITDHIVRVTLVFDRRIDSIAKLRPSPFLDPEFSRIQGSTAKDVKIERDAGTVSLPKQQGFTQVLRFHPELAEVRFDLAGGPLFGLGLGNKHFNRAGHAYPMKNGQRTGEQEIAGTRLPISVLYSPEGWGLWFHQPEGAFDLSGEKGVFRLKSQQPMPKYVDIFFFRGEKPRDLISAFTRITGRPIMPPRWALGFMQSHRTLSGVGEVYCVANTLREKELPCDSLIYLGNSYCPSGWNKRYGSFEFNTKNFDKPKEVLDRLHAMNFRVFLHITGPTVRSNPGGLHGTLSDTPADKDDLSHVANYWEEHREHFNQTGVDAWWADDGDRLSREDRLARHRMYHDGYLRERPDGRPIFLNRTGSAGMQRFGGFLGSGDNYSKWETLRAHVPVFLNASVSGLPYVGSCIGGFWPTKELDGELYTRWFQFSAFTPYFRAHGRTWHTRLPWGWNTGKLGPLEDETPRKGVSAPDIENLNNPKVEPICRKYLNLRYQLLPYTYTLSRMTYETGEPLMQPMWLHFPEDGKAVLTEDQFFWGRQMLIAPVLEKDARQRNVYLPKGSWYDFWTNEKLDGPMNHAIKVDLAAMPIFIPAGSILPLQEVRQHLSEKANAPLEIRIYPGKAGYFTLYDDDGLTQKYKTQAGERISFAWQDSARKLRIAHAPSSPMKRETVTLRIKLVGSNVQRKVTLGGNDLEMDFR